jgi:hypothetical protein
VKAKVLTFMTAAERQRMREGMKKWAAHMRQGYEDHQRKLKRLADLERQKWDDRPATPVVFQGKMSPDPDG